MSNLFTTLRSAASSLDVLQKAVTVTQNNVLNASTPGYVRQRLSLESLAFNPRTGLIGGVSAGNIQSARNSFAEESVRREVTRKGADSQDVRSLTALESIFPVNDSTGIAASLSSLLSSFSAWSVSPNSTGARQNVLSSATRLSQAFNRTARELSNLTQSTNDQLRSGVEELNALAGQVREYNHRIRFGAQGDAGLDAQVHEALERMATVADVHVLTQSDGTYTVLLGGSSPLVVGENQTTLQVSFADPATPPPTYSGAVPGAHLIREADGTDITAALTAGELGSLFKFRNSTLPSYQGDGNTTGLLNDVAKSFADRVNQILSPATPLFTYNSSAPLATARTLAVDPAVDLTAVPPDAAGAANGKMLELAGLASPVNAADQFQGTSYSGYLGELTAGVGRLTAEAKSREDSSTQLVLQSQNLRSELSGVSLDEEAVRLIEFQRAYQAAARMVTVVSEMSDIVNNMFR